MSSPFLSREEVMRLTGYKYAKYQAAFLTEMGIRFTRNHLGEVIVAQSAIDGRSADVEDEPFVLQQVG
jgi:hypothetical protein